MTTNDNDCDSTRRPSLTGSQKTDNVVVNDVAKDT